MKIVKVIMLGAKVQEYEVSAEPTIAGLVNMMEENDDAGREFNGTFTRNGVTLTDSSALVDGDRVYYAEKLKGNQLIVKIIRPGALIVDVAVEPGSTIRQALNILPDSDKETIFDSEGNTACEFRINGGTAQGIDSVIPGEEGTEVRLIIATKIKGNE